MDELRKLLEQVPAAQTTLTSATPGYEPSTEVDVCQRCDGAGKLALAPATWQRDHRGQFITSRICRECGGFGAIWRWEEALMNDYDVPSVLIEPAVNPQLTPAVEAVERWAAGGDPFLILSGPVGTGKTVAACHAGWRCIQDHHRATRFYSVPRLMDDLRETQRPGYEGPSLREVRRVVEETEVVILDDLRDDRQTEFAVEQLFLIVDARWTGMRRTIVTTNADPKRIEPRIASRLLDTRYSVVVACGGKDRRRG